MRSSLDQFLGRCCQLIQINPAPSPPCIRNAACMGAPGGGQGQQQREQSR